MAAAAVAATAAAEEIVTTAATSKISDVFTIDLYVFPFKLFCACWFTNVFFWLKGRQCKT